MQTWERTVKAPAEGVSLQSELTLVMVEVTSDGAPVKAARLSAVEDERGPRRGISQAPQAIGPNLTNARGEAVLLVAPERSTPFRVSASGMKTVEFTLDPSTLEAGPSGIHGPLRIELTREPATGTLAWHVGDAHGAFLLDAQATCWLAGAELVDLGSVPITHGVATFTGVPVGEWTASLALEFSKSLALAALPNAVSTRLREPVVIQPLAVTELRTPLARGGRLVLTFEGLDPMRGPLEVKVCSAGDSPMSTKLYTADGLGHRTSHAVTTPGPHWVERALPPGAYTVVVQGRSYATTTRKVQVEAGRNTSEMVQMGYTED